MNPRGSQGPSGPSPHIEQVGRGRALDGLSQVPPAALAGCLRRGTHLPAVIHGHEITDQQEGVGQHAHCDLQGDLRVSEPTYHQPPTWAPGAGTP